MDQLRVRAVRRNRIIDVYSNQSHAPPDHAVARTSLGSVHLRPGLSLHSSRDCRGTIGSSRDCSGTIARRRLRRRWVARPRNAGRARAVAGARLALTDRHHVTHSNHHAGRALCRHGPRRRPATGADRARQRGRPPDLDTSQEGLPLLSTAPPVSLSTRPPDPPLDRRRSDRTAVGCVLFRRLAACTRAQSAGTCAIAGQLAPHRAGGVRRAAPLPAQPLRTPSAPRYPPVAAVTARASCRPADDRATSARARASPSSC